MTYGNMAWFFKCDLAIFLIVLIVSIQMGSSSWPPNKKLLREEELCRSKPISRPKRDLRVFGQQVKQEHSQKYPKSPLQRQQHPIIKARAFKPATEIPLPPNSLAASHHSTIKKVNQTTKPLVNGSQGTPSPSVLTTRRPMVILETVTQRKTPPINHKKTLKPLYTKTTILPITIVHILSKQKRPSTRPTTPSTVLLTTKKPELNQRTTKKMEVVSTVGKKPPIVTTATTSRPVVSINGILAPSPTTRRFTTTAVQKSIRVNVHSTRRPAAVSRKMSMTFRTKPPKRSPGTKVPFLPSHPTTKLRTISKNTKHSLLTTKHFRPIVSHSISTGPSHSTSSLHRSTRSFVSKLFTHPIHLTHPKRTTHSTRPTHSKRIIHSKHFTHRTSPMLPTRLTHPTRSTHSKRPTHPKLTTHSKHLTRRTYTMRPTYSTHPIRSTPSTHLIRSTPSTHPTRSTHSTHPTRSTHSTHPTRSTHSTHPTRSTPSTHPIRSTPSTHLIRSTHSTHPTRSTPSTHPIRSTPSTHPTRSTHSTHPTRSTHSTHPTRSTHSTHPTRSTHSTHPARSTQWVRPIRSIHSTHSINPMHSTSTTYTTRLIHSIPTTRSTPHSFSAPTRYSITNVHAHTTQATPKKSLTVTAIPITPTATKHNQVSTHPSVTSKSPKFLTSHPSLTSMPIQSSQMALTTPNTFTTAPMSSSLTPPITTPFFQATSMFPPVYNISTTEEPSTTSTTLSPCQRNITTTSKPTTSSTTNEPLTTTQDPKDPCSTNTNFCTCHKAHCGYHVGENHCSDIREICKHFSFSSTECIRFPDKNQAEIHYIYAGVACPLEYLKKTKYSRGPGESTHCRIDQTILAINLGRNQRHLDGYGIQYMADNEIPWKDPHKTRKNDVSLHLSGVDKKDQWLYRWQIWGDWNKAGAGHCVTYEIPLSFDGEYELNLKMIDNYWRRRGNRGFNVRLNGITILVEIDLIRVTKKQFKAVDLILNFQVEHQGSQLVMSGYPNSNINHGSVDLSFCFGECNTTDEDYHVAGFSVVKFIPRQEVKSSQKCYHFRRLPCLCRGNGCEYSSETGDCRLLTECSDTMFQKAECRRSNAFYANGGILCKNAHGGGSCDIADVILAVNFNGRALTDSRGIHFVADNSIPYEDKWRSRTTAISKECYGVSRQDKELYCKYIEGVPGKVGDNRCISWKIPIVSDGSYEMNLKLGEFNHDNRDEKSFNVKINEEVVIKELDILMMTKKNTPIDIILPFTVMGNGKYIWLTGYALRSIDTGEITLSVCYGSWQKKDTSWTISAFSVVRFRNTFRNISIYTLPTQIQYI